MSVVVHTVTYEVEASDLNLFRASINQHAETTRQREIGCTRYDVSYGADRATMCLTYAMFEGPEAFNHHLASDHYYLFREISAPWVISRVEQVWDLGASPKRGSAVRTT